MYDLAIVGAGWAGFNAALQAHKLGLKVKLIDKNELGGTCLNLGCIPTKTLIQSSKVLSLIKKSANFGISCSGLSVDFIKIQERKDKIVRQLQAGMKYLISGIDFETAQAHISSPTEIKLSAKAIQARHILIATGSRPLELAQFKFDAKKILSSDEMLSIKEIPASLLIVGAGAIGCEFASLFCALGSKVTLVEKLAQLAPGLDNDVSRKLESLFKKKGIRVFTGADAASFNLADFDKVLVCVGRVPCVKDLGLEDLGVRLNKGIIQTDKYLATNIGNVYAAGDCASGIMLAHFAGYQGRLAAQNIARPDKRIEFSERGVPGCIFTDPEVAYVGLNENAALEENLAVKIHKFDFLASGMARILDESEGFIKIISDKNTGEVLGSSIIGPKATELIGILTLAVSSRLNIQALRNTIFSHPTISESIAEALN